MYPDTHEVSEARRPPANWIGATDQRGGGLMRLLQLLADLQVATVRKDVRHWLADQRGRLLEVGCGDRPYRSLVPAWCEYSAIDTSSAPVDFGLVGADGVIYYAGPKFPFADAQFDALFHTEVLEHVFEHLAFLRECRRMLKPGGRLMFTVPFQARYHFIPHDYFRFTPSALRLLLEQAQFREIGIAPRGTDVTVAAYKAAAVAFRWAYSGWSGKLLFLLSAPLTLGALAIAHLSLYFGLGSADDCLGYTVTATADGTAEHS